MRNHNTPYYLYFPILPNANLNDDNWKKLVLLVFSIDSYVILYHIHIVF